MTASAQTATGEQFYVTHCVTADSVMNAPGYSVRASTDAGNGEFLRLALEYPPYELPLELWREKPTAANAPRRLARTPHPHGGVWVVHSAYLEKDTMNRDRSYFSHLLHLPDSTNAASVLRSWDAPGWVKDYPPKADKILPRGHLPQGTSISDESLSQFLSGRSGVRTDLASAVSPARLSDGAARKELALRFLQGLLLATREDPDRDRFFVHAEPGLVAMLLFAATRLLPQEWTADLTFSTFEPAHRGLRDYTLAAVIGTYTGPTGKGLDPELVTSRGYGLDTFRADRSSSELAGTHPPGLTELIDLAARGEWELLADVHRLIGVEADALGRVSRAVPLARAIARLKVGKPTVDDLLTLKLDPRGAAVLAHHADKVWPHIHAAALSDARIRGIFKDWLREPARLEVFRQDAANAVQKGDLATWDAHWSVIREVAEKAAARKELEELVKNLDDQLPEFPLPIRSKLRDACAEAGLFPDHHLLAPNSQEELNALLSPPTPAEWQGYTCFAVMSPEDKNWLLPATASFRPAMRLRVRGHLLGASPAVLGGYLKQAHPFISSDPVFLHQLLQPYSKHSPVLLDRLIEGGAAIVNAEDWLKLLSDLDVYNAPEWKGFLFQNDHLAKLLAGFQADPVATGIWGDYLALLSAELFNDDEWELTLYGQLSKAREALGKAGIAVRSVLPDGGTGKLNAIDTLLSVIARPESADNLPAGEMLRALQVFWPKDVGAGLAVIYHKGRFAELDLPREAAKLNPFVSVFRACFPITHEYFSVRSAVAYWLQVSELCPADRRAAFQFHLVHTCIVREWYPNILGENWRTPFMPEAVARISEAIAVAATAGERYVRPAAAKAQGDGEDLFASPATKRAKKGRGRGRGAARRGRDQSGSPWVWVVIVVGLIAAIIIGVAVYHKFGGGNTPTTEPDPTPPPPAKSKPQSKKDAQPKHKDSSNP